MNNTTKVSGTAFIEWSDVLKGEFDLQQTDRLDSLAKDDHWIIFWEDPVRMIFRQIKDQERISSEELLQRWMESALEILKAVRRHRNQVSLINLAEAQEHPDAFSIFCKESFGLDVSVTQSGLPKWAELNPVFQKISQQSVKELQTLLEELGASSVPLDSSFETTLSSRSLPPSALFAAIDVLRKMEHDGISQEQLLAAERQVETAHRELAEKGKLIDQKNQELSRAEEIALGKYEMLLTELHEAFKESEGYFEQWKKAESTGHGLILKVDSLMRGNTVDHGSHRHLDFSLTGVELLGRSWHSMRVRLLRHNGRSGILFFESEKAPFYAWEPSGEEGGTKFMLFVPSDTTANEFLLRATTSDLLMVKDSVATILADLRMNGLPEENVTDWITVAESLLTQVAEIPERLHYDSVQSSVKGSTDSHIEFDILNALFRGRLHQSLKISWDTNSGVVTLYSEENARPLLSAWPIDSAGRNRDRCELFEPSPSGAPPHPYSVNLTNRDRAFLEVLLGEVPNFLVHAANQHPTASARLSSLLGKGRGLRKKALKLKSI